MSSDSAFPSTSPVFNLGLSKREYFAALAMQGILSGPGAMQKSAKMIAQDAVMMADCLLVALGDCK